MADLNRRTFLRQLGKSILALPGATAWLHKAAQAEAEPRLNLVVILVDDLGWTDLSCYGSDLHETPNIDCLASQGLRFTDAYAACTVCLPTRAALMTGRYPAPLHLTNWIPGHEYPKAKLLPPEWTKFLRLEEHTIAEVLRSAGYATAHIGKWHLGDAAYWPRQQGYDVNRGGCHLGKPPSYISPYGIPTLNDGPPGEYLTDRETNAALSFIEAHAAEPFFVSLAHYAVHTPLQAKSEVVQKYQAKIIPGLRHDNAKYAAMIDSIDENVGRLMARLDELDLTDTTVIVFTSDNGGVTPRVTDNYPLRGGKGSAYEGGVRVPFIVCGPGIVQGRICREPVITCDLFPTLLELAQVSPTHLPGMGTVVLDGVSLVPLFHNPSARLNRRNIFWHDPHYHPGSVTPYGAVRSRDWKLIEFYEDMHVELYNLYQDIGETKNLAAVYPDVADCLRRRLHRWRTLVDAQMPTVNPNYDPNK
ncbi:MAG: sulfatase [Candidatus Zipacnadales bacterium]